MSKYKDDFFDKYNWIEIQDFYNNGNVWRDIIIKYNITNAALAEAVKRGLLITRSKSESIKLYCKNNTRILSEETKNKISKSRKKYLIENPDKVPYLLNHSSKGPSYPESYFEKIFKDKLKYEKYYRIGFLQL